MNKIEIDSFVGNGPSPDFIRSVITPTEENYETDVIRFIKESGVVPEETISIKNGGVTSYDENGKLIQWSIGNASDIEFIYKQQYERFRNKSTLDSLKDGDTIFFNDNNSPQEEGEPVNGLSYKSFVNKTFDLENPDDIVLNASYINLFLSYPCWKDHVTFRINANDPFKGFSRKELAVKAMERFHLLYYLCTHYNINEGKIDPGSPSYMFTPVLYLDEYIDNGLHSLTYQKKENRWEFTTIEQI